MNSKHTERWEELRQKNPRLAMEYLRIYSTMEKAQKHFNNFKRDCESWLDNIYKSEIKKWLLKKCLKNLAMKRLFLYRLRQNEYYILLMFEGNLGNKPINRYVFLSEIKKYGLFRNVPDNVSINEILRNCEVIE